MEKVEFEKQLLEAIKKDDLKSFDFLMPTNADLNLCFGRFPVLSLLYLYSSFKILKKYERYLMPVHNYKITNEPIEIYKDFKIRARKTLRLFGNGVIVYPILMLAVLNEKLIIENKYKFLYKNVEINEKLNKIYNLNHKLDIIQNGDKIIISSQKLNKKNYIFLSCLSLLFCLIIALSSLFMVVVSKKNGLGTEKNPIQISTASEFKRALLNGKRYYNLNKDIEISENFTAKNFSGVIYGNGHTVKLVGDFNSALVTNLSGIITSLKFYLNENDIKITQNSAIITEKLTGIIENCEINGNFSLNFEGDEALYFGMYSSENSGKISNCRVSISSTLNNLKETDAYFGGIAGINTESGEIVNCNLDCGVVQADTVDLAGIVCENNGKVITCTNKMQLSQTSSKEWHPNVAGISITNNGSIEQCLNYGELLAESTLAESGKDESGEEYSYSVILGGVVCDNNGAISSSENHGLVSGKGIVSNLIAGGISAINYGTIETSKNYAEINLESTRNERGKDTNGDDYNYYVIAGGLTGNNFNSISDSRNFGLVSSKGNVSNIIVGGLVAQNSTTTNLYGVVQRSLAKNNIIAKSEAGQVCVGGAVGSNSSYVLNCGFVGEIDADSNSKKDEQIFTYKVEQAVVVFAGGVVGVNNDAVIRNCYSDATFKDMVESDEVKKLQAGVVGMAGIINLSYYVAGLTYVSNNYYIVKESIDYVCFGIEGTFLLNGTSIQYQSGTIYSITNTDSLADKKMTEVISLNDIPAGVVIDE